MNLSNFVRNPVREMSPIQWGKAEYDSSYIILKWGENPYLPSRMIRNAIGKSVSTINRYPNLMNKLKIQLCKYTQCKESQICITNGSDKAFRLIAEVFINENDEAITFSPSYPVFDESIKMMGGKVKKISLNKELKIPNLASIKRYITNKTKIIYICNPNNPTGNFMANNEEIKALLEMNLIVVVDEAYFEFSNITALVLLKKYSNLIILRSFSKTFGLAGLRVSYLLSSQEIVSYLISIEDSLEVFNTSVPSLAGAISALENFKEIKKNIKKINNTKKLLCKQFSQLNIYTYPSSTSFLMFSLEKTGIKTKRFIKEAAKQKLILKDVSIYSGLSEYDAYMAIPSEGQFLKVVNIVSKVINNLL